MNAAKRRLFSRILMNFWKQAPSFLTKFREELKTMKAAKNIHSFTKYDHGLLTGMDPVCILHHTLWPSFICLLISLPDHHQSHHKKDCRWDPYCSDSKPYGKNTTNSGSYGKYKNNTKEMQRFVQGSLLFCSEILWQTFRTTPQIADTHRTGISISMNLSESLHLHGTWKWYHDICDHI